MNIPQYATCSQCVEFSENRSDWKRGTCGLAAVAARAGCELAGISAHNVIIEVAWDAKPCSEWEASREGQRDIDQHAAEVASIAQAEGRAA